MLCRGHGAVGSPGRQSRALDFKLIGDRNGELVAAYFVLQAYYKPGNLQFQHTLQDNVYGPWVEDTPSGDAPRPQPAAISEPICHELQQLQQQFCQHWLFFGDDPARSAEA